MIDEKNAHAEEILRRKVKTELRRRMRGLRNAVPGPACGERSAAIRARLEAMECLRRARTVALFWPMEDRHEVDLRPLDITLRARGVRIAYPSIDPETRVMTFRYVGPAQPSAQSLEERGLGFAEPAPDAEEAPAHGLDVIVVPALAVDPTGQRIGYGAGFYDRTVPRFSPPAVLVGVAFDYQVIAEVPVTAGDVPVHHVVTDARTFTP